jgi:hypothetical protein
VFIHFCAPQSVHCEAFGDVRERLAKKYMGENVRIFVLQMIEIEVAQFRQRPGFSFLGDDASFWQACSAGTCMYAGPLQSAKDLEDRILQELGMWKKRYQ